MLGIVLCVLEEVNELQCFVRYLSAAMNSREGGEMCVDVTTFALIAVWVCLFCSSKLHDCITRTRLPAPSHLTHILLQPGETTMQCHGACGQKLPLCLHRHTDSMSTPWFSGRARQARPVDAVASQPVPHSPQTHTLMRCAGHLTIYVRRPRPAAAGDAQQPVKDRYSMRRQTHNARCCGKRQPSMQSRA